MALVGSTIREKLVRNFRVDGECWRWTGSIGQNGYGRLRYQGHSQPVHRVVHEVLIGPIPEGHDIDHVFALGCRFRDCIRPTHLEAVTPLENQRRKVDAITHCPHGHEYTEANSMYESNGRKVTRRCRACRKRGPGGARPN